jgi:hypothetical protein
LFEGIVSLDGSKLDLASKVTVRGAGQLVGFAEAFAFTVYLLSICDKIFDSGVKHLSMKDEKTL